MCLSVPMRVMSVEEGFAEAELGGVMQLVSLALLDPAPAVGDYLIVHAGFAIQVLDEAEARRNLALLRELAAQAEEELDWEEG